MQTIADTGYWWNYSIILKIHLSWLSHLTILGNTSSIMSEAKSISSSRAVAPADMLPRILTDLGAKTRVMELMSHSDSDVRYHALISVQRLVSHPWTNA